MSNLKSIDLKDTEHRPNYRILSIQGEIQELKQVLYWMKIMETYQKALHSPESPTWEVPEHGKRRTIGWGNIGYIETEIRKGEEMIAFLRELLLHGILWYNGERA